MILENMDFSSFLPMAASNDRENSHQARPDTGQIIPQTGLCLTGFMPPSITAKENHMQPSQQKFWITKISAQYLLSG